MDVQLPYTRDCSPPGGELAKFCVALAQSLRMEQMCFCQLRPTLRAGIITSSPVPETRRSPRIRSEKRPQGGTLCAVRKPSYFGPVFTDGQGDRGNYCVPRHTPPPPYASTALSKHGVGVELPFVGIFGTTVFVVPDVTWGLKTVYHTLPPDDVCFLAIPALSLPQPVAICI